MCDRTGTTRTASARRGRATSRTCTRQRVSAGVVAVCRAALRMARLGLGVVSASFGAVVGAVPDAGDYKCVNAGILTDKRL